MAKKQQRKGGVDMKKIKIYKFISSIFLLVAAMLSGFHACLLIYDRHLCCDKGSDWIIYFVAEVVCLTISIFFYEVSENIEEDARKWVREQIIHDYIEYLKEENETKEVEE